MFPNSLFLSQGLFNWFSQAKGGKEESSSGRNSKENTGRANPSQRGGTWEVNAGLKVTLTEDEILMSLSTLLSAA